MNYFNPLRSVPKITYITKPPIQEHIVSLAQQNNDQVYKSEKKIKPKPGERLIKQFQKEQNRNSKKNLQDDSNDFISENNSIMEEIIERIAMEL